MTTLLTTTNTTALTAIDTPTQTNPVLVYLASLSESSRRPQRQSLDVIAKLVMVDSDVLTFPFHQLRYEHTQAIRSKLAESYSASTANRHLSALRGVLKECWRLGYMSAEGYQRAIDVKPIKGEKANQAEKGRHIKQGEFSALIDGCMDGSKQGIRNAAIVIIGYTCGLRRAEIAGLQVADYNVDDCTLTIRKGKGNKERVTPLGDTACDVLADWLQIRGTTPGALFTRILKGDTLTMQGVTEQAVYHILAQCATNADVKEFSPHDLRRTFAGDLLDAGADISTVQKLMGHANVNTTARYDRRDAKAKRQAVNKLHIGYQRQFS